MINISKWGAKRIEDNLEHFFVMKGLDQEYYLTHKGELVEETEEFPCPSELWFNTFAELLWCSTDYRIDIKVTQRLAKKWKEMHRCKQNL